MEKWIRMVPSFFVAGIVLLFVTLPVNAQTISGTVTDAETGNPIPGANIDIPEVETGAATDAQGEYE